MPAYSPAPRSAVLLLGLLNVARAETQAFGDAQALVQLGMAGESARKPVEDFYVSTVETPEDFMYWLVMYATLHQNVPQSEQRFGNLVFARRDTVLGSHQGTINYHFFKNKWFTHMHLFMPEKVGQRSADAATWQELMPFTLPAVEHARVVHLRPDMVVLRPIGIAVRPTGPQLIMAREQGECADLEAALDVETPSNAVFTMIPSTKVEDWLRSPEGLDTEGKAMMLSANASVPNTADSAAMTANAKIAQRLQGKSLANLAYKAVFPQEDVGLFSGNDIMSFKCLLHHRDDEFPEDTSAEDVRAVYLGKEGKELIQDLLTNGDKSRVDSTIASLRKAGKGALARALRAWFDAYFSPAVQDLIASTTFYDPKFN